MPSRPGKKSKSQTPAPMSERITGSKKNPKGSASSERSASKIKLSKEIIQVLENKLNQFKKGNPSARNVGLNDLKAVMRRGMGAYSKTHRPTITGGKPNTRQAWGFARVNKFLKKAAGEEVKKAYVQDDDLLKFKDGGSVLLAPNGKPSNLTPEQYRLVRTPEFKAWFGDWENDPENASKVVDENGEPLVVYHGSKNRFSEFSKQQIGTHTHKSYKHNNHFYDDENEEGYAFLENAFYFTNELNNAIKYGENEKVSGIVYSVFLKILNPIIEDVDDEYTKDFFSDTLLAAEMQGNDGVIFNNVEEFAIGLENQYAVFEPNQIKLADGSNTTFDSSNPDIRYAKGGELGYSDEYVTGQLLIDSDEVHILDWNSKNKVHGGTVKSLLALREKFKNRKIYAIDTGYYGEPSYQYWDYMMEKGLIDGFRDDEGLLHVSILKDGGEVVMTNRELISKCISESSPELISEINYYMEVNEENDGYDISDAFEDYSQMIENDGRLTNDLKEVYIRSGFAVPVDASKVYSTGKKYWFKFKGQTYAEVESWEQWINK